MIEVNISLHIKVKKLGHNRPGLEHAVATAYEPYVII